MYNEKNVNMHSRIKHLALLFITHREAAQTDD